MARPIGLDLTGWHDFGCRDWQFDDPSAPTDFTLIDGGLASVIVGTSETPRVGGPQAVLSPLGRGGGWGKIGDTANRRLLALIV